MCWHKWGKWGDKTTETWTRYRLSTGEAVNELQRFFQRRNCIKCNKEQVRELDA